MMELTAKQVGLLRALYEEKSGDIGDFMDETGLSFACIDNILSGKRDCLYDSEIAGLAKGFEMTEELLLGYLEVGDLL